MVLVAGLEGRERRQRPHARGGRLEKKKPPTSLRPPHTQTTSYGRQIPFAALEAARTEFAATHAPKASTAAPNSLDRAFGPRLAAAAAHAAAHPEAASRVAGLQRQVDEVKSVMVDNIEQVLARGERLEALVDKTDDLRSQADRFQRTGAALRRRMWWNNVKVWILIASLVLGLILVIALTACFSSGKNCFKRSA